jgi:nicotinate-nucleotide adenylyltransferase
MPNKKIAVLGGTFDPIHIGHTTVADAAAQYVGAENIFLVPAKCSPLKSSSPLASDQHRLNMVRLAIEGSKEFSLSDYELKKPEPSYTLNTVRWFKDNYGPDISVHWLVGADTVSELPYWYKVTDLIDECSVSAMYRAGFDPPDFSQFEQLWGSERIEKLRQSIVPTPLLDISSTEIRRRLAAGLEVCDMLHPAVEDYVRKNGLYTNI